MDDALELIAQAVQRIEVNHHNDMKLIEAKIGRVDGRLDRIEERLERLERKFDRNETRIEALEETIQK